MHHFRVADPYLNRFLEPLEAAVMSVLWAVERATLRDIQRRLAERPLRAADVRRALECLAERGYVKCRTVGRGLARRKCYRPVLSKEQLLREHSNKNRTIADAAGIVTYTVDPGEMPDAALIRQLESSLAALREAERPC